MLGKPKTRVALIVSKLKEKEPKDPTDFIERPQMDEEDADAMGLEAAAEEILAAVEAKDAKRLSEALMHHMELCSAHNKEEAHEEEE